MSAIVSRRMCVCVCVCEYCDVCPGGEASGREVSIAYTVQYEYMLYTLSHPVQVFNSNSQGHNLFKFQSSERP